MPGNTFRDFTRLYAKEDFYEYFDDFTRFTTADWIQTTIEAGSGSATKAIQAGELGGVLLVTNDNADGDRISFQLSGGTQAAVVETFKYQAGKKFRIYGKFKQLEVIQSALMIGVYITNTTPLAGVTDGIYIRSNDASAALEGVIEKNSNETIVALGDAVANTYNTFEIYFDGTAVNFYLNGTRVGATRTLTNLCDDEELAVSFAFSNGQAVINTFSLDYLGVQVQR